MKPIENTQEGAAFIEQMISDVLEHNHQFKFVVIGMEATGFYGVHLANYLSASDSRHSLSEFTASIQRKLRTTRSPLTTLERMMA